MRELPTLNGLGIDGGFAILAENVENNMINGSENTHGVRSLYSFHLVD